MRLLHLSDLHLGRRLGEIDLYQDQAFLLEQLVELAKQYKVDALLIAGDVYDRTVPSVGAMQLLDDFLTALAREKLPVYIISGNHDSADRLGYASGFLAQKGVYLASVFTGSLVRWQLQDEYGPLTLWALPFIKPAGVRHFLPEEPIESCTDAVAAVIRQAAPDFSQRNLLMAHQFVVGHGGAPAAAGSESVNVGTLDDVDASVFDGFDYVALGHIHGAQAAGRPQIRYCGAPMKYSVAEANHIKSALLVEVGPKGQVDWQALELPCLHQLRRVEGPLEVLVHNAQATEDYIYAVLTDQAPVMDAAARLRAVYPNLVKIDFTYARTLARPQGPAERQTPQTPLELFDEFYSSVHGAAMDPQERALMAQVFEEVQA